MSKKQFSTTFLVLAVLFVVCLIASNFFASRVWNLGFVPVQMSGAVLIFPISYIINDCLAELYGYRKTRLVIVLAFVVSIFVALMTMLMCALPEPVDAESLQLAGDFNNLNRIVPRATVASLLAFFFGSNFNAWILCRIKSQAGERRFWLRAVVSSLGGEVVDSLIFFPIVYWGILSPSVILGIFAAELSFKILYELAVLPLTSYIVKKLKKYEYEN